MDKNSTAPVLKKRGVIEGVSVAEAMQRQVIQLSDDTPVSQCIRHIIKFKTNAVMVADDNGTPLSHMMVGPPYHCYSQDPLKSAIDRMQTLGIHQLYVHDNNDKNWWGCSHIQISWDCFTGIADIV